MAGSKTYGDSCRLAHALDLVGRRWGLLIVRELLLGPKRFSDLRRGLPNASSNILAERLRELEEAGVIRRATLPPPLAVKVYELTEWGDELEDVVTRLGAWGARAPSPPDCDCIGTDSIVLALRSLFDPERAEGLTTSCRLEIGGEDFTVDVADGRVELRRGAGEESETAIEADSAATLAAVLTGQLAIEDAEASGALRIERGRGAARRFLRLFPMPEGAATA
jgi:DNA-binding HxlR family transcriptional regulator